MSVSNLPDAELAELLALAAEDDRAALARLDLAIEQYEADPRLHFLKGSLLAAQERYAEGRAAMRRSVALAPGYDIARFQLGLLELSSGDAEAADATLEPLANGSEEGGLPLFALGLRHLMRDDFDEAEALLRRGIAINAAHPLVSRDMELMLSRIAELRAAAARAGGEEPAREEAPGESGDLSEAHLLLQRYAGKDGRH
jgi:Flp pilus assembly protein TadD